MLLQLSRKNGVCLRTGPHPLSLPLLLAGGSGITPCWSIARSVLAREGERGYAARWRDALSWGEELVLALRDGRVAGFGWVQVGTPEGVGCHYATMLAGEFRVLRVGVLPACRRQGVNGAL
jgi:ribosomal protein S18 acetylase RimI-like enzyme